jgi:hypothetical protein
MLTAFRRPTLRRLCTLLVVPSLAAACHRYVPVTGAAPVGARVAVQLTDRGTVELARYVGPGVGALEGEVVAADDSAVTISVSVVRQRNGIENYWAGEQVVVDRDYLASFQERQVSRPRTAAAAGGFALIVGAIAAAFILGNDDGSTVGRTPGGGGR